MSYLYLTDGNSPSYNSIYTLRKIEQIPRGPSSFMIFGGGQSKNGRLPFKHQIRIKSSEND